MKTSPTMRGYVHFFTFLLSCFFSFSAMAQCPGVKVQIKNGPLLNLCAGSSVTLTAETSAANTMYQWQKQTSAGGAFDDIAGAASSSYSTSILGAYRVIAGNGTCSDTSSITSIMTLNITGGTITGGPASTTCIDTYIGSLSGPSVPGDEMGVISYQWQMKEGNGTFNNIPSATGLEYNAGYIKAPTTYRRAVSDNCGNIAYSNELTINTYALITPGTLQPALQTIFAGASPSIITSAIAPTGGGTLLYKWQASLSINGPWETIDGATDATLLPGPLQITTYFRRITSSAVCSYSATSEPVLVVVKDPVILNAGVLYSDNACLFLGNTPYPIGTKVKPVGGVLPYLIEWESKTESGNWTLIPGEHGDKLFPGPITASTSYRKKVTDAAGTVAYTEPAFLSVISTPLVAGEIHATANVACLGSSSGLIFSTKSGANYGERGSYQWQVKTANSDWTDIPGARRGDYQPQPLTEKSSFRRVFYDSCGPNSRVAFSNEVEIDTRPALFAGDINPSTQTVIPGRTPKQLTSIEAPHGGTNSYTIWWEKADLAVGPWTKIPGASGENYQPPVATKTTYYRRVVKDNNCLAEKFTFIIEVFVPIYPPVVGGVLSGSTCVFPGNTPSIITTGSTAVSGGITPYTFQWESRSGAGAFTEINGAVNEQYQPPVLLQTTQYRRKITDVWGTMAYSDTFSIQLISTALIPGKIAVSNASICAGASPGTIKSIQDASGLGEGAHYQWQQRTETGSYTDIAGANANEYTPATLVQTTYFRRAFADACGGVNRIGYSNEVMIKATPATQLLPGLVDGPFITCAGSAPGTIKSVLDACGSCNLKYQWETNKGSGWTIITGANGASYTPATISVATKYRRKVTDGTGATAYSNEVEILVYPEIFAGTIGIDTQTVCIDALPSEIALLTDCHYTDGTVTYQWQFSTNHAGPWTDIAGANAPAYQPTAGSVSKYYRLKVMSATCNAVVFTNVASVLVKPACNTTITSTATGFSNCLPVTPVALSYPIQSCNADYTFEWEYQSGAAASWTGTGVGTNNLMINSYYLADDQVINWRLKMTNTSCNSISYSNVLPVSQYICRPVNLPIVYPNPATAGHIIIVKTTDKPHQLKLMTIDGKRLDFKILSTSRGLIRLQLPAVLPSGTYILLITSADGQWAEKILIKNI